MRDASAGIMQVGSALSRLSPSFFRSLPLSLSLSLSLSLCLPPQRLVCVPLLIAPPRPAPHTGVSLARTRLNAHFYDDIKYDYAAFSRCPRVA